MILHGLVILEMFHYMVLKTCNMFGLKTADRITKGVLDFAKWTLEVRRFNDTSDLVPKVDFAFSFPQTIVNMVLCCGDVGEDRSA